MKDSEVHLGDLVTTKLGYTTLLVTRRDVHEVDIGGGRSAFRACFWLLYSDRNGVLHEIVIAPEFLEPLVEEKPTC